MSMVLNNIDQIGIVVEDVDESMEKLFNTFGIGPWEIFHLNTENTTDGMYYGEPAEFEMYLSHSYVGDIMIELIEPLSGPTIHQDFLDEEGEGVHHIANFSWTESQTYNIVEQFKKSDVDIMQSAHYGGAEFWYFDTLNQLDGLCFETGVRHEPIKEARTAEYTYP